MEMLNISTNYGIDKINKDNELQLKNLEQEILKRKTLEQERLRQQELQKQKLEQQKLEQEKTKQKEKMLNKQLEQQKLKQQQQQQQQRHDREIALKQIEKQLKQRMEQQKINDNKSTIQFDSKKDQSTTISTTPTTMITANNNKKKNKSPVSEVQTSINISKPTQQSKSTPLVNEGKEITHPQSNIKLSSTPPPSLHVNNSRNSNIRDAPPTFIINCLKQLPVEKQNYLIRHPDKLTKYIKLQHQHQLQQQQQQQKQKQQQQQEIKQNIQSSVLLNSTISSTPQTPSTSVKTGSSINDKNNNASTNNINGKLDSINVTSLSNAKKMTTPSSNLSSLPNKKNLLSDLTKVTTQNKTTPASYISVSQNPIKPNFTPFNNKEGAASLSLLKKSKKLIVTQSTPTQDYTSLLSSNHLASVDNAKLTSKSVTSALASTTTDKKQQSNKLSTHPSTSVSSVASLKGPDYSSLIGNTSITTASLLSDTTKLSTTQSKTTSATKTSIITNTITTTSSTPVTTKPSGPDFSSLLNATIVPTTQAITDIIGSQKITSLSATSTNKATTLSKSTKSTPTLIPPSIPTNLVNLIGNQKLGRLSSATSSMAAAAASNNNINSLLGASLTGSLPGQDLSTASYSLLGMNAAAAAAVSNKLPVKPATPPNFPMFLPNSGIGTSSIVTSPYLLNNLPNTSNIPLPFFSNPRLINASLPTSSSQQSLTSAFLTNNVAAATVAGGSSSTTPKTSANKLKNNPKNPQLRTFPYY
ncbi:hypothetical protein BCR32DRAFT_329771 [Anaeromyces robustus]|uniref:Uncharacterized protein n=1 Tax=Anaeromyces robustus TaxID=1754192 RepID=A0A1Y1WPN6_9FUNG|nr:hypothetical protein BCR32DRAFT_329771 [Anaeromyces robustus]|eukprot:ORX75509.1 hypothetical protein BCR32DRAFT_329771 [Anaeromyces robustus]